MRSAAFLLNTLTLEIKVQGIPSEIEFSNSSGRGHMISQQFAEFIKTETETVLAKLEAGVIDVDGSA